MTTDQQLIADTAAAIAEDLLNGCERGDATSLRLFDGNRDMRVVWYRQQLAVCATKHLTAMLAKRSDDIEINDDPMYDIRVAVAEALRICDVRADHKEIVDMTIDQLPDFFRQSLCAAERTLFDESEET